jgi:hypothetical protein
LNAAANPSTVLVAQQNAPQTVRGARSEQGGALLISMAMLLALGFVGAALITTSSVELKVSGRDRRGTQAQFAAEAGVQEAMHRLAMKPGTQVTVGGATFDAAIRDTSATLDPDWEVRIYSPQVSSPSSGNPSLAYTPTVQDVGSELDYLRDGSMLSIRHKWQDRNGDGVRDADEIVLYDAIRQPPENFVTGSPIEVVEAAGFRADARRRLRVEVIRHPISPGVYAAMFSIGAVDITGSMSICGHNHDPDIPVDTDLDSSPPCSPNYDQPSGHLSAVASVGSEVTTSGSSNVLGQPAAVDTSASNPFLTLAQAIGVTQEVVDELLANADHTSLNEPPPLDGVTYINGNATGGERLDGIEGSGLLYVNGDLEINSTAVWRGLIYVEGSLKVTGNPWILGSVIVRSEETPAFAAGNASILYSRIALQRALEGLFGYEVLSWKEQ